MPLKIYSYESANQNSGQKTSGWPRDNEKQRARLAPFCRPQLTPSFTMGKDDLIFTVGSCFARNIERQLIIEGYNVAAAQFQDICIEENVKIETSILNKFVAHSVLNELMWALEPSAEYPKKGIVEVADEKFIDLQLAPGFRPMPRDKAEAIRRAMGRYMRLAHQASVVIMTLGLAEAWFDNELGIYLNSPPMRLSDQRFPGRFELHVLSYEDIVEAIEQILGLLDRFGRPNYRFILTVSPVAMGSTFTESDVFVANCYSKSVQRAAAEFICRKHPQVDYLPTYESVTLSERSVAWADDCAHVSDEIVRLNVSRMIAAYTVNQFDLNAGTDAADNQAEALEILKAASGLEEAGKIKEAEIQYKLAKQIAPYEAMVRLKYGTFLLESKRYDQALVELEAANSLGKSLYGSAFSLARTFYYLGRSEEAEVHCREAVRLEPTRVGVIHLLGRILVRIGKIEEGLDVLGEAIAAKADNPRVIDEYVRFAVKYGFEAKGRALLLERLAEPQLGLALRALQGDQAPTALS